MVDPLLKDFDELLDHPLASMFPDAVEGPAETIRLEFKAIKAASQMVEVNAENALPSQDLKAIKKTADDAKKKITVLKTMMNSLQR